MGIIFYANYVSKSILFYAVIIQNIFIIKKVANGEITLYVFVTNCRYNHYTATLMYYITLTKLNSTFFGDEIWPKIGMWT